MQEIAITGANGAVGRAILSLPEACAPDLSFVACVRSQRACAALRSVPAHLRIEIVDFDRVASLAAAFRGAESVIHLAGALIEAPGSSYEQANVASARVAVEAAAQASCRKLVLISATGANPVSSNRYYASKGQAEELVRSGPLEHTILRPPLILGTGSEGEAALLREISAPHTWLLGGGHQRQQPLDVTDLARAALNAARPGVACGCTLDLVGPESLRYRDLVLRAARCNDRRVRIRRLPIPIFLLRALLRARRRVTGVGFSADALDVILDGGDRDPEPAARALGLTLTALDDTLSGIVERANQEAR